MPQYLLTEEERAALVPRQDLEAAQEALQWCFEKLQPERCPYKNPGGYPYCSEADCPIEDHPFNKRPGAPPEAISRLICKLSRAYGK